MVKMSGSLYLWLVALKWVSGLNPGVTGRPVAGFIEEAEEM